MKGQFKFKPGTVVLFFFIAIVGYTSYTLVSGNITEIGDTASERQDSAMSCSELDIQFVDVEDTERGLKVYFRSNKDLSGVNLGVDSSNETKLVRDVGANGLYNATLNVSDYENVYIETNRCPNAYWWR